MVERLLGAVQDVSGKVADVAAEPHVSPYILIEFAAASMISVLSEYFGNRSRGSRTHGSLALSHFYLLVIWESWVGEKWLDKYRPVYGESWWEKSGWISTGRSMGMVRSIGG